MNHGKERDPTWIKAARVRRQCVCALQPSADAPVPRVLSIKYLSTDLKSFLFLKVTISYLGIEKLTQPVQAVGAGLRQTWTSDTLPPGKTRLFAVYSCGQSYKNLQLDMTRYLF